TSASRNPPFPTKGLLRGKEPAVRYPNGSSRLAVSIARLENSTVNPGWRNAFLFMDGKTSRRRKCAPRGWARERHEHDLRHHPVPPRDSRRRDALRLRRRFVAEEM